MDDVYSEKIEKFSESPLINWVGIRGDLKKDGNEFF